MNMHIPRVPIDPQADRMVEEMTVELEGKERRSLALEKWLPLIGYTITARVDGDTITHIVAVAEGQPNIELWSLPNLQSDE